MKKLLQNICSIGLILSLVFSSVAYAAPVEKPITQNDLKTISLDQIPDGVKPIEFSTKEEALNYLNHVFSSITVEHFDSVPLTRSTNGTAVVAKERIGVLGGEITLKLRYGTSGDSNTGTITYVDPFTVTDGFTYGFTWDERSIGAQITSSGKDVYAYSDGSISAYLLVDGLVELYQREVNLEGMVMIIR